MGHNKSKLIAAPAALILGTTALTGAAQAQSEEGFRFYGFINGGVVSADDGVSTTTELVDNSNAPSRLGFWFGSDVGGGTMLFNFETALGLPGSSGLSQTSGSRSIEWSQENLRKVEIIYDTNAYGKFYLGQGSMASDGITGGTDLSGTGLVGTVAIADTMGGFQFRDSTGALSGTKVSDVFKDFDGTRKGRVRYDTPEFGGGFVVSASAGQEILKAGNNDRFYDLALRYNTELGDTTVKAMAAYLYNDRASNDSKSVIGSVGALHNPSGVSGQLVLGDDTKNGNYIYGKVGYQKDWFATGRTYLSVDAFRSNDVQTSGDKGTSWGIQAVQKIDSANMEVFASYQDHKYSDTSPTSYQGVKGYMLGARWRF